MMSNHLTDLSGLVNIYVQGVNMLNMAVFNDAKGRGHVTVHCKNITVKKALLQKITRGRL